MKIETHRFGFIKIAELVSENEIVRTAEDGLNLIGDLYYQGFDGALLYAQNITPDFFNLRTGIAGEILQKFTNYRMKLAIVGDFTKYEGKSLSDFIRESNKSGQIIFMSSVSEALARFSMHG